ncbi:MAG: TetR/AcrR family transcriptional regulator [Bacteroidota bacterium]
MESQKVKRKAGRPTEKQSVDLNQILRVALKYFAKDGFGGVSLSGLAKNVGVADSNLYHHFKNKETLWKHALQLVGDEIIHDLDELARLIKDLDGIEQMKLFHKKIVFISAKHPEFQQIVVQEMFSKSDRSKWLIEELLSPIYGYVNTVQQKEQAAGRIKTIPSANLTSFIIGSITTLFSRSYQMQAQYGVDPFAEEEVERHADIINDLLFHGMLSEQTKLDT